MSNTTRLAAKVEAVNKANAEAVRLSPILQEIFKPFVGQQIVKKGTTDLLNKIDILLPPLPNDNSLMIYKRVSSYSLVFNVKVSVDIPGYNTYVSNETSFYVASLDNRVLDSLYPQFEARCDYTVEEVLTKRKKYAELQKLADEAKSDLYPFGEYDT